MWSTFASSGPVQFSLRFIGIYLIALYLAMVFWTVRDAQQRTENQWLPYVAGAMVVVLNVLGLFIYLIVRPRETLHEAYERQLAEESLLGEAERRVVCPSCKERVDDEFLLCPTCRTRLKRRCPSCAKLIKPEWNICPFCAKDFDERDWTVHAGGKAAD
ncbi:MAG: zinc ribbon domain-containing protein [Deltaproteobacteria bacterium]|nr:zinc ribbon domain-containing protein [Deltaproteobacteria bacterium]